MKKILLTQSFEALVDDSDYARVSKFNWTVMIKARGIYAYRKDSETRDTLYLHHFILGNNNLTHHKDGSGLNNQRENLRQCTQTRNMQGFKRKSKTASSTYRGVSWDQSRGKWDARIKVFKKQVTLGRFLKEKDAALAYDIAARKYFGDFACPNFL